MKSSSRQGTPRERAEQLLELHGGSCFVPAGNDLGWTFQVMEVEGLVTAAHVSCPAGLEIRPVGFSAVRENWRKKV